MVIKYAGMTILTLSMLILLGGCPRKMVEKGTNPSMPSGAGTSSRLGSEQVPQETKKTDTLLEKTLVAQKYPGIEGEVLESKLLKDIHFDFDRYDIRPGDAEILRENGALLLKYPQIRIQVEGHCDERGTAEYNLALGQRRASSAKAVLVGVGIPPDRISTISYGEERPLDPGHYEAVWAKNRRAHFVVLPK